MFGPSFEDYDNLQKTQAINTSALLAILASKGICTVEEFEQARLQQIAVVDQAFEERKREHIAEQLKAHPGYGLMAKMMGMELPLPADATERT